MAYYIRAYATNAEGTAYGNQLIFTTNDIPTVVTSGTSSITQNSATISGNVTSDGGTTVTSRGICWSTSANPTTADNVVASGSGTGSFNSNLTSLDANTTYHARAYATNGLGTAYGADLQFTTLGPCAGQTTVTYNGYSYPLVEIGNQCWFQENLKTGNYRNGDPINYVTNSLAWDQLDNPGNEQGGSCYYTNDQTQIPYGRLYNWYAVNDARQACPLGWHVPSFDEWAELRDTLGGTGIACGKMKVTTLYPTVGGWEPPNTGATNSSGFSAVPSGGRTEDGIFFDGLIDGALNNYASWWTSTEDGLNHAFIWGVGYDYSDLYYAGNPSEHKNEGNAIRCIKDQ
jgi:uncharacterized protein (TIGR02145 family)